MIYFQFHLSKILLSFWSMIDIVLGAESIFMNR